MTNKKKLVSPQFGVLRIIKIIVMMTYSGGDQAALPKKTELASKTLNGIKQSPAQDGQDQKNTSPHK